VTTKKGKNKEKIRLIIKIYFKSKVCESLGKYKIFLVIFLCVYKKVSHVIYLFTYSYCAIITLLLNNSTYMLKKIIYTITLFTFVTSSAVFAFQPKEIAAYFNGPTIGSVTSTSAEVFLSPSVLSGITDEEKSGIYFEYGETEMVCIAIYPIPETCLPKKNGTVGTATTITGLKPDTSYTITYKHDNTIRCITTPCPANDFQSLSVEFKTKAVGGDAQSFPIITKYLVIGSRGSQVVSLQSFLINKGYLSASATGYYGPLTFSAMKKFQNANGVDAVGVAGPITRKLLATMMSVLSSGDIAETFEGRVTAYSTGCFSDGVCSITVDGKKVITIIGRLQGAVGQVRGISDFGAIENNVGAHAKVYAKKTSDGYTLYGSADYYVEIVPAVQAKLPAGSTPSGDVSSLKDVAWVWQKTVAADGSTVTPNKTGFFTVTLGQDGRASGTTDCNSFFGSYSLASDGFVSFGPLASTMMFCNESQESLFTGYLAKVSGIRADELGNLTLTLANNSGTMYFVKK
jgi:heat shock protein HslJ